MAKVDVSLVLLLAPALFSAPAELDRAQTQYNRANYKDVVEILKGQASTGDPAANALTGKAWFMLAEYRKSAESFEAAVARNPGSSDYYHWLGKAYGRRAETSNPLSAP